MAPRLIGRLAFMIITKDPLLTGAAVETNLQGEDDSDSCVCSTESEREVDWQLVTTAPSVRGSNLAAAAG